MTIEELEERIALLEMKMRIIEEGALERRIFPVNLNVPQSTKRSYKRCSGCGSLIMGEFCFCKEK